VCSDITRVKKDSAKLEKSYEFLSPSDFFPLFLQLIWGAHRAAQAKTTTGTTSLSGVT
jgi:hypothetical protein